MSDDEFQEIASLYTNEQYHQSLKDFLYYHIIEESDGKGCRMQVSAVLQ